MSERKTTKVKVTIGDVEREMIADELYFSERNGEFHLIARRWEPASIINSDNPFLGTPSGEVLDGLVDFNNFDGLVDFSKGH